MGRGAMEEHGYGYDAPAGRGGGGGGAGGQDPSAGSAAAARPRGWSSLTRQLRNPSPPPRDPFPPLVIATAPASSKNRAGHALTNSGEKSEEQGGNSNNNKIQQRQRGATASPASSTGSFSSNYSGRNHSWDRQGDAQAAFSSTAAGGEGDQQQGVFSAATRSPPESSSGSFAPNSSISKNPHPILENHHGLHRQSNKGSGPTSSAGSFSLNPYSWVQSGAYDARVARFQSSSQVVVDGMEEGGSGGGKRGVQVGQQVEQVHGYKSALKRREFSDSYEVAVVDEGTRDETSAAQRDILDNAKPAVSDGRSSIGDADRDFNGAHEQQGKDTAGDSTAASSAFHVPIEPEWEEEDMYHSIRSGALKESRARDKFARGASQAYVRGDHRKAKALSKQAEEKRLIAEKLHAEAAFEILNQRNKHGSFDIWHLDLHGLHTAEAVAALESRLTLLEHGLAKDHKSILVSPSSQLQRGGQDQGVVFEHKAVLNSDAGQKEDEYTKHKLFQSLIPASKLLSVITGVGAHSQQGPSLPSAVKTFLINNGYQLEEPRAGVVSVHPKLHFSV